MKFLKSRKAPEQTSGAFLLFGWHGSYDMNKLSIKKVVDEIVDFIIEKVDDGTTMENQVVFNLLMNSLAEEYKQAVLTGQFQEGNLLAVLTEASQTFTKREKSFLQKLLVTSAEFNKIPNNDCLN